MVLRKLIAWLSEASKQLESIPALVIDDEADQAGVATNTINPLIRSLLDVLPRVGYVGYTATPFANLFIDPSSDDLYPQHFIVDLPQPPDHFGTESIFGREPLDRDDPADYDDEILDMVRIVPDEEVPFVRPATSHDVDTFVADVCGELRRSILYFWLATAARRVRGTGIPHSTMLIHTALRLAVHESFRAPITRLQEGVLAGVESRDGQLLAELRTLWESETRRVPAPTMVRSPSSSTRSYRTSPWSSVNRGLSLTTHAATSVSTTPATAWSRLPSAGTPFLRRLTLEGLIVSYFVRAASAYDTSLQMGRWFGYRAGYADLPRIWMTDELHGWFRHLASVEAEIRHDMTGTCTANSLPRHSPSESRPTRRLPSHPPRRCKTRYWRPPRSGASESDPLLPRGRRRMVGGEPGGGPNPGRRDRGVESGHRDPADFRAHMA